MDLHAFCKELGFDEKKENFLAPRWEELCSNTENIKIPEFMTSAFYRKYAPVCGLPDSVLPRMDAVADIVAKNPVCARYAAMLEYGFFKAPVIFPMQSLGELPDLFGENAGVFQLMVAMSAIPLWTKTYGKLGLPEKYALDSAKWIGGTSGIYAAAHNGIPGHTFQQTRWIRYYVEGKLFRIGRLEYMLDTWKIFLPAVYINRKDHSISVLCRDQWAYNAAGQKIDPAMETPAFTARIKLLDHYVTGTPIMPNGYPRIGRKITLDLNEWEPLCSAWELVPGIHIPGGGGMKPELLKESLIEAKQFFRKYFATDVKAFSCGSWLFNPMWEKELPDSNIAAFQRNVYLTGNSPSKYSGLFFVYGRNSGDPREWQCTTSIHKAFCRIFDRNENLADGFMFILAEDVEKFGTEYYRKKYQF